MVGRAEDGDEIIIKVSHFLTSIQKVFGWAGLKLQLLLHHTNLQLEQNNWLKWNTNQQLCKQRFRWLSFCNKYISGEWKTIKWSE